MSNVCCIDLSFIKACSLNEVCHRFSILEAAVPLMVRIPGFNTHNITPKYDGQILDQTQEWSTCMQNDKLIKMYILSLFLNHQVFKKEKRHKQESLLLSRRNFLQVFCDLSLHQIIFLWKTQ